LKKEEIKAGSKRSVVSRDAKRSMKGSVRGSTGKKELKGVDGRVRRSVGGAPLHQPPRYTPPERGPRSTSSEGEVTT